MTALGIVALCFAAWIATSLALGGLFIWLAARRDWDELRDELRFACEERDAGAEIIANLSRNLAIATNHPSVRHLRSVR